MDFPVCFLPLFYPLLRLLRAVGEPRCAKDRQRVHWKHSGWWCPSVAKGPCCAERCGLPYRNKPTKWWSWLFSSIVYLHFLFSSSRNFDSSLVEPNKRSGSVKWQNSHSGSFYFFVHRCSVHGHGEIAKIIDCRSPESGSDWVMGQEREPLATNIAAVIERKQAICATRWAVNVYSVLRLETLKFVLKMIRFPYHSIFALRFERMFERHTTNNLTVMGEKKLDKWGKWRCCSAMVFVLIVCMHENGTNGWNWLEMIIQLNFNLPTKCDQFEEEKRRRSRIKCYPPEKQICWARTMEKVISHDSLKADEYLECWIG